MISVYSVGEKHDEEVQNNADMGVRIELGKAGCVCLHPGIDHAILTDADGNTLKALDIQGLREVLAVWAAEDSRPRAGFTHIILDQWLRGDRP